MRRRGHRLRSRGAPMRWRWTPPASPLPRGRSTASYNWRASSPPPVRGKRGSQLSRERPLSDAVVRQSSRRSFLERLGGAVIGLAGASALTSAVLPDEADAYTNFCGHTYTTGNCPAPTGLPRIDRQGYPLRAHDGVPVDAGQLP